jgi:uracil phosphoribosyltransferase
VEGVTVVGHPLVQHKLTLMRDARCSTKDFRELLGEIAMLICYEVTRDLPLSTAEIETPLTTMQAPVLAIGDLVFAPILRAGSGFLHGLLQLVPSARVAYIGLYRNPDTLQSVQYYFKAPPDLAGDFVIVVDPMLATGNSAVAAVNLLKEQGATNIRLMTLLCAPEGIRTFRAAHPDVHVWTAAVDSHLNDHGYIVPGLGDAGDRMFGTK